MNLMLAVIFVCITLGLLVQQPGRRENLAIAVLAATMTALYYFVNRFL